MLYRFFSGDFPITLMLYAILWFATRGRHSLLRDLMSGDTPRWNRLGQVTVVAGLIFPLWVAVADNWRQLLGYSPFLSGERWQSDPFQTAPTALSLRLVTVALGLVVVLGLATLYARRRGSLLVPMLAALIGAGLLNFIDPIRMRVDALMLGTETDLNQPHVFNVAFILFWAMGLYFLLATGVIAAVGLAWGVASLPVKLIYWLVTRGESGPEAPVFSVFHRQVEQLHADGPAGRARDRNGSAP